MCCSKPLICYQNALKKAIYCTGWLKDLGPNKIKNTNIYQLKINAIINISISTILEDMY